MKKIFTSVSVVALLFGAGMAFGDDATEASCEKTEGEAAPVQMFIPPPPEVMFKLMNDADFKHLIKADLSDAVFEEGGWVFEDGVLTATGKGDLWTKERYGNFILALEFKCAEDTNSGVFIRCGDMEDWLHTSIEAQILQNNDDYENERHHCGGIFDCLAPMKQMVKAPGEWNKYVIIAQDNQLWVFLNNELTAYMDLDKWTEPHKNLDGTNNKFNNAYKDMPREGHIGFQYHGHPIAFRNIRVEPLD
jgi:hypothetical protein